MSPDYYREQANAFRKRASQAPTRELATKWMQMAAEYDQLAGCFQAPPDASSKETGRGAQS
jgi:hypothetical protein